MSNIHFYRCESCGIIAYAFGEQALPGLKELIPNTVDASGEKHLPVVKVEGDKVTVRVGSVDHPTLPEHWIQWVLVETDKGFHRHDLNPAEAPEAVFTLPGEKVIAVYEYCNLHGLWKTAL